MSYLVAQKTRETGIRLALGASPGRVISTIVKDGSQPVAVGVALGAIVATLFVPAMSAMFFEITLTSGAITFLFVAMVVMVATLVAMMIPAVRGSRVSPSDVLGSD